MSETEALPDPMEESVTGPLVGMMVVVGAVLLLLFGSVRTVSQGTVKIVERLGRYRRTLEPGLHTLVPSVDRVRAVVDMREQVVTLPPQSVVTSSSAVSDRFAVSVDLMLCYQVTQPAAAVYEVADYGQAIEQLTVAALRNVIGAMGPEQALASRDQIGSWVARDLADATGRWGVEVTRVEVTAIGPSPDPSF